MKIYEGEWPDAKVGRNKIIKTHIVNAILQGGTVAIEQSDHPTLDLQKIANLYRTNLRNAHGKRVEIRVQRTMDRVLIRRVDEGTEF